MSSQQPQWSPLHQSNTQGAAMGPDPVQGYPPHVETSHDWSESPYHRSITGDAAPPLHLPIRSANYAPLYDRDCEMQPTGQALAPNQPPLRTGGYQYHGRVPGATGSFVSTDITTHNSGYHDTHQRGGFGLAAYNTADARRHMLSQHNPTHQEDLDGGFDLAPESHTFASNNFATTPDLQSPPMQYPSQGIVGQFPALDLGPQVLGQRDQILPGSTVPGDGMMTGLFPGDQYARSTQGWVAGSSMASGIVAQASSSGRPSPSLSSDSVPNPQSPSSYLSSEQVVQCPSCSKTIGGQAKSKNARLQRHMKTHDSNRETFSCQDCKHMFTRKDNLRRHQLRKNHGGQRTK